MCGQKSAAKSFPPKQKPLWRENENQPPSQHNYFPFLFLCKGSLSFKLPATRRHYKVCSFTLLFGEPSSHHQIHVYNADWRVCTTVNSNRHTHTHTRKKAPQSVPLKTTIACSSSSCSFLVSCPPSFCWEFRLETFSRSCLSSLASRPRRHPHHHFACHHPNRDKEQENRE